MQKLTEKEIEDGVIKVGQVCSYIDANLSSEISLLSLVEVSSLNYQDLIALFRVHKNTTPMQYVRSKRLKANRI